MDPIGRQFMTTLDYVIFALTLLLSSAIGIYFAYKGRNKQSDDEYLLANRSVHWLPLFISMVASFFSAGGVLGIPALIYTTGITFYLWFICFLIVCSYSAEVFVPLFRRLNLVSVNEFLGLRFGWKVQIIAFVILMLQYSVYLAKTRVVLERRSDQEDLVIMSIVLYAPALALESVAGVPLIATIISTGVIVTFYTSIGGMRAVIWTDVFQCMVMVVGLLIVVGMGVHQAGSLAEIFRIAKEWKRLEINLSADPTEYHTLWGITIGLTIKLAKSWAASQNTMQRMVAAKSEKHAKIALYMSSLGITGLLTVLMLATFAIFATHFDCDLVRSKQISGYDQILPYFIITVLGDVKGIPGLFTACIFSFSLSTISSGLNGMSALFLKDVLTKVKSDISSKNKFRIMKLFAIAGGAFVTGFAFVIPKLGKFIIKLAMQVSATFGAPLFAMFIMGHYTHRANTMGVYIATPISLGVGVMFAVGQMVYPPFRDLPPVSIRGCSFFNSTSMDGRIYEKRPQYNNAFASLVSVSYVWHGPINFAVACFFIYVVGLCTSNKADIEKIDKKLLYEYKENIFYKVYRKLRYNGQIEITTADKIEAPNEEENKL